MRQNKNTYSKITNCSNSSHSVQNKSNCVCVCAFVQEMTDNSNIRNGKRIGILLLLGTHTTHR
jgi:hypothetical protein